MKIDIDSTPEVVTLGDLNPGEVFQFNYNETQYYMRTACYGENKSYFVNLYTGKRDSECKSTVVRPVPNAQLTNK